MPGRSALLPILAAALLVGPAQAQRKELTVLGGGTLSGASGGNQELSRARAGFVAGVSLRLPRTAQLSLEPQLLVLQRRLFGQRPASSQSPLQAGPLSDAANLVYVEVPLLLRLEQGYSSRRPLRPYVNLGPYVGVRVACRREVTEAGGGVRTTDCSVKPGNTTPGGTETFFPALYQDLDLGLQGGVGLEIRRLALGVRFERSLRNLVEPGGAVHTSPLDGSRLWSVLASAEYLIRIL